MPQKDHSASIDFGELTDKNIGQLKLLNSTIFPVKYNDKFYTDLLLPERRKLTKLAYYCDVLVGAVCCRIDDVGTPNARIYIMTLGVLAPYRTLGIGAQLLNHTLKVCQEHPEVQNIYLHVQVNNEQAISFYKKFGYEIKETIENYYKRIEPSDCYVLQKSLK